MCPKTFRNAAAVLAVFGMTSFTGCSLGGTALAANDAAKTKVVPVEVTPAAQRAFEERITVQGNLDAKKYAMVAPLIDGTITDFFVDEGDAVKAGKTKLFQSDKVKVERAVAIAEQDLALAKAGQRDADAQLASVQAQYDKAKLDFDRYTRLFADKAITPDTMEQVDAGFKVAQAGLDRANTGVAVAAERLKQAESVLAISKKTLADSLLIAPIDGIVSMRMKEPGEFCGAGTPVLRIVDPTVVEVSAYLPGEYYTKVVPGETKVHATANGVDAGDILVTYKSPEIQPTLRNFEVKCLLENPPTGIVPGALANIAVTLAREDGIGVLSKAIQRRAGKDWIFVVDNAKAKAVEIARGLETEGWTQIRNGAVAADMPVITMGQFLVEEGVAVNVMKEGV